MVEMAFVRPVTFSPRKQGRFRVHCPGYPGHGRLVKKAQIPIIQDVVNLVRKHRQQKNKVEGNRGLSSEQLQAAITDKIPWWRRPMPTRRF